MSYKEWIETHPELDPEIRKDTSIGLSKKTLLLGIPLFIQPRLKDAAQELSNDDFRKMLCELKITAKEAAYLMAHEDVGYQSYMGGAPGTTGRMIVEANREIFLISGSTIPERLKDAMRQDAEEYEASMMYPSDEEISHGDFDL